MGKRLWAVIACGVFLVLAHHATAAVYITEFCSDTGFSEHFEFAEFTNLGSSPVDMTGWSEDDSHATANKAGHSLTGLGVLAPGESGIFTEAAPDDFRSFWGLPDSVPVVGPYTNDNLSTTSDSITLFNSAGVLVDRLDYSTTNGGSADSVTRNCPVAALGQNDNGQWVDSYIGDAFGSYPAPDGAGGTVYGNPGTYAVPEPSLMGGILMGCVLLGARRQRA